MEAKLARSERKINHVYISTVELRPTKVMKKNHYILASWMLIAPNKIASAKPTDFKLQCPLRTTA